MQIKIKYFSEDSPRLTYIGTEEKSNWIDLYTDADVTMMKGSYAEIPLGVSMELPAGYEAIVAPRSSIFKNFGVRQANSIGIIDTAFHGPNDQWKFPCVADRDTVIPKHSRLCQFRIQKRQPHIEFIEDSLEDNEDRGGVGTTGV